MAKLPHVFIVDDEQEILQINSEILAGIAVVHAFSSPIDFLDYFETENPIVPDLVITDLRMPKISGVEMVRTLLQKNYVFPVILLSGELQIDEVADALNVGFFKVIQKPAPIAYLLECIEQILIEHDLAVARKELRKTFAQLNEIYSSLYVSISSLLPKDVIDKLLIQNNLGVGRVENLNFEEILLKLDRRIEEMSQIEIKLEKSKQLHQEKNLLEKFK